MQIIETANENEWLQQRTKGIGGSDIAAITGLNPYSSPMQVWLSKTDPAYRTEETIPMEVGKVLEGFIRKKAEKMVEDDPVEIQEIPGVIVGRKPHHQASIDGYYQRRGQNILVEIKTTNSNARRVWEQLEKEYPDTYYAQIQWYLGVTGWPKAKLIILTDNREIQVINIPRDEEDIEALQSKADEFWENYVMTNTPPPATCNDSDAIKYLWPKETEGKTWEIPTTEIEKIDKLIFEMKTAQGIIEEQKKVVAAVQNALKAEMQDAEIAMTNEYKITFKTVQKAAYTVPESSYRVMRITNKK